MILNREEVNMSKAAIIVNNIPAEFAAVFAALVTELLMGETAGSKLDETLGIQGVGIEGIGISRRF
ncbi:4748_t:CDS:2 [Racocetra persica]|uniref:4748_t:CDS:1 n=1 Tax=Racocetra persica TaxID=160502 RepID=A0ACA9L5U6_9GLOM|nr:4748_t:CDS:2 [Racocetra persica]